MASNDSPAFDVLSAEENDLWEWAVERAGVENAATYIRDVAVQAERDTDLARARVEENGEARAIIDALRDKMFPERHSCSYSNVAVRQRIDRFRDEHYPLPAPKPAECRLSDGSVVTFRETAAGSYGPSFWRTRNDGGATMNGDWRGLLTRPTDTGADFDALKAFATTHAEGTDGL